MVLKQNVGIDLSMNDFEVNISILSDDFEKKCLGRKKFTNNAEGFDRLLTWVETKRDPNVEPSFTIEFTGVYYECLAYYLKENKKIVHMVVPSKSKKYCESLSIASKTDKLDAQSLSWMGLERKLKEWSPISGVFLSLRALTREREEVLKEKTIVSNRMHAMGKKAKKASSTAQRYETRMELLKKQIQEIEIEIQMLIEEDETLEKKFNNVLSIPGVGTITAATIIAETNGFAAILNSKQLTSYAGLDVKLKESGKYIGKSKISKQGNAHIRRILHFPAQTAIIYNKPLTSFYERVNAKKVKPMIAAVGVQRKLLCLIYALWKSDNAFDPNYEINKYHYMIQKVG